MSTRVLRQLELAAAAALLVGAAWLAAAPTLAGTASGRRIREIHFDWPSYRTAAPGSDNWPLTWCEDDYQYTSWGDGGGFGGTNTTYRVSLGFARVEGDYPNFVARNLWGGRDPVSDAQFHGKVQTLVCIDGRLYGWHSQGSEAESFIYKQLIVSEDKGVSWQEDAFPQTRMTGCAGCPGLPYMINYGRNYELNEDGYVYTYWVKIQDPNHWAVQIPGVVWLMRAPVANRAFTDPASWSWLVGFDANGHPLWGHQAQRVPVLEDPDGVMRNSAVFVPGLRRFLMVTNHTERLGGNLAIWESPTPWGPWSLVLKDYHWPSKNDGAPFDSKFAFGNFSPKWFSADGRSGVFVWFRPDGWQSVAVEIVPEDTGEPPPQVPGPALPAVAALALALIADAGRRLRSRRRR